MATISRVPGPVQHLLQLAWPHPVCHPTAKPSPDRLACCSQTPARADDACHQPRCWFRANYAGIMFAERAVQKQKRTRSISPSSPAATGSTFAEHRPLNLSCHLQHICGASAPKTQLPPAALAEHRPLKLSCHRQHLRSISP